jgi:hypothetical protein
LNDANEGCGAVPGAGRPEFVPLAGTQSRASEFAVPRPTDLFFGNDLAMELQGGGQMQLQMSCNKNDCPA